MTDELESRIESLVPMPDAEAGWRRARARLVKRRVARAGAGLAVVVALGAGGWSVISDDEPSPVVVVPPPTTLSAEPPPTTLSAEPPPTTLSAEPPPTTLSAEPPVSITTTTLASLDTAAAPVMSDPVELADDVSSAFDGTAIDVMTVAGGRLVVGISTVDHGELAVVSDTGELLAGPAVLPVPPRFLDAGSGNTPYLGADSTLHIYGEDGAARRVISRYESGSWAVESIFVADSWPADARLPGVAIEPFEVADIVADGHDGVWVLGADDEGSRLLHLDWVGRYVDRQVDLGAYASTPTAGELRDGTLWIGLESGQVLVLDAATGNVTDEIEPAGSGSVTDMISFPGAVLVIAREDGTVTSSFPVSGPDGPTSWPVPGDDLAFVGQTPEPAWRVVVSTSEGVFGLREGVVPLDVPNPNGPNAPVILGSRLWVPGPAPVGYLFRDFDYSGRSVGIDAAAEPVPVVINDIAVVNADVMWAIGYRGGCDRQPGDSACAAIARSVDSGETWEEVTSPNLVDTGGSGYSIVAASATEAFVVGSGRAFVTDDGGLAWREVPQLGIRRPIIDRASGRVWAEQVLCDPCHAPILVADSLTGWYTGWSRSSLLRPVRGGDASPVATALLAPLSTTELMVLDVDTGFGDGAVPVQAWRVAGDSWESIDAPCDGQRPTRVVGAADSIMVSCDLGLQRWDVGGERWFDHPYEGGQVVLEAIGAGGEVWSTTAGGAVIRVIAADGSWRDLSASGTQTFVGEIETGGDQVVALDSAGVWISDDAGETWRQSGPILAQPLDTTS